MSHVCSGCNKLYSSTRNLKNHIEKCKVINNRKLAELKAEITRLNDIVSKNVAIEQERDQLRLEIVNLKHQLHVQALEKDLSFAKNQIEDNKKQIEDKKQDIKEFKNHLFEQSAKARYTTIINNLAPFTLTPESVIETSKLYTVEDFKRGPEATIEFITEKHLKDESGKPMVVCTDGSRLVFRGNGPDGEPFVDLGGDKIVGLIRQPMRRAVANVYRDIINNEDESVHEPTEDKWRSHRRALEPKRLTKALAGKMAR